MIVRRQAGSPAGRDDGGVANFFDDLRQARFDHALGRLARGSRTGQPSDRPAGFGSGSRAVELHGDAYFDVRHDAASPFAVRVGSALIQDVGTTFMVESDDANATVVTVVTGSVRLRAADSASGTGVVLAAGERGSIDDAGRTSMERSSSPDDDMACTTGRLVFREAQLSRVVAEVHRWYGVRIHVSDPSMLSQHVTTTCLHEPIRRSGALRDRGFR